ncbi:MAG: hypothetical protein H6561_16365 [Lewinellaceae bacterium]|nr:hypothetical protein [Lewinellaceae bacterium]
MQGIFSILARQRFLPLLFILAVGSVTSVESDDDWKLTQEKNGVSIYYRPSKKDPKLREMKINVTVSGNREDVINHLKDEGLIKKWMQGLEFQHVSIVDSMCWIAVQGFEFPWPISNKVNRMEYRRQEAGTTTYIFLKSLPMSQSLPKGYEEMSPTEGQWEIHKLNTRQLVVIYKVRALQESPYPRWVQDPIIQKSFLTSFDRLRTSVQSLANN